MMQTAIETWINLNFIENHLMRNIYGSKRNETKQNKKQQQQKKQQLSLDTVHKLITYAWIND